MCVCVCFSDTLFVLGFFFPLPLLCRYINANREPLQLCSGVVGLQNDSIFVVFCFLFCFFQVSFLFSSSNIGASIVDTELFSR